LIERKARQNDERARKQIIRRLRKALALEAGGSAQQAR
jgi:hypothetical protein